MSRSTAEQLIWARRLLTHEGGVRANAEQCAAAAGRVYDKLSAQLAPLLGTAGASALFARSVHLAAVEHDCLADVSNFESSKNLRDRLRTLDPVIAAETAEALFGTFFALLTTFIGERLLLEVLRAAFSTSAHIATESEK